MDELDLSQCDFPTIMMALMQLPLFDCQSLMVALSLFILSFQSSPVIVCTCLLFRSQRYLDEPCTTEVVVIEVVFEGTLHNTIIQT